MRHKTFWIALAGLLVLGAAQVAASEEAAKMSANGHIVSIDAKAGTVSVKTDGKSGAAEQLSLAVGPETKILRDGKTVRLGDLKAGDKVSVEYESVSGKNMARLIGVMGEKPA